MNCLYLTESGEIIKNGLSRKTGAQALNNLTDIVDIVEEVERNVENVETISKSLKKKADHLQTGLGDTRDRLLELLEQCHTRKCDELKILPEIRSLRVQNDFQNVSTTFRTSDVIINMNDKKTREKRPIKQGRDQSQ